MQAIANLNRRRLPMPIGVAILLGVTGGLWQAYSGHAAMDTPPPAMAHTAAPQVWARAVAPAMNLYQMSPTLYRSALPTAQDAAVVKALGIRTVVSFIKDDDRQWAKDPTMRLISLPMHADRVTDDEVLEALRVVKAAQAQGPVLMHCKHGNNRTGIVAAMYRTVVEGWPREAALAEMQHNGFGTDTEMAEAARYVRQADITAIGQAFTQGSACVRSGSLCAIKRWVGVR